MCYKGNFEYISEKISENIVVELLLETEYCLHVDHPFMHTEILSNDRLSFIETVVIGTLIVPLGFEIRKEMVPMASTAFGFVKNYIQTSTNGVRCYGRIFPI